MSSRALRKLQRSNDVVVPELHDLELSEEEEIVPVRKSKKKKTSAVNPFALLKDDEEQDGEEEEVNITNGEQNEHALNDDTKPIQNDSAKSRKKKKKKKRNKEKNDTAVSSKEDVIDEVEASVREVNAILGELPPGTTASDLVFNSDSTTTMDMRALLYVEHKHLNPDTEMRRIFGSRVVQNEVQNRRRGRHRVYHRQTWLTQPKESWPQMTKLGLSMRLLESRQGVNYFCFEHSSSYQQIQFQFLDAVESFNPENIVAVLNLHPYHIDALIQLSEVCKMSDDTAMATELIERSLYSFECNFHTLFSLTQGTARLDYRRPENRAFFVALFRHLVFVGQKGCYRTALEFGKLILSFDPDNDPLCVLLMIDFYALRSEQYNFIIRMYREWEAHRNLTQLPNFAFSIPLAMFHNLQTSDDDVTTEADEMLQNALLMFPGMLLPLLDKCSIKPDPDVEKHKFFSTASQNSQPVALRQLIELYIGRCHSCWKQPEVVVWLESNVREVITRVNAKDPLVETYKKQCAGRYKGTPRNIYRHILMSEIKDATAALPPELSASPVMSYDPLPPKDSIVSYTRPERPRRINQDSSNPLSMFFRSLLPNFNPDEPLGDEEPQGAEGGQELRQGIGALMHAMRDLLNNIQPVPPPREDGGGQGEGVDQQEWQDDEINEMD
ncbi:unnamed protein product [Owenia fusiformis]|uniref:Uncharacterized protein n=1 Tax=Owenia fusiformis TaxID=6347 RepID=A0A8J1XSQ1_OWEFU|nr:unnamed protein product [Owenia fusiformis]